MPLIHPISSRHLFESGRDGKGRTVGRVALITPQRTSIHGIEMYEPLVVLPFLVQSDATEANLTGFFEQLHPPRSPEMRMSVALARV